MNTIRTVWKWSILLEKCNFFKNSYCTFQINMVKCRQVYAYGGGCQIWNKIWNIGKKS